MEIIYKNKILVFIVLIICIEPKYNDLRKINKLSEITLTIIGNGTQYIFKDGDSRLPSELFINGKNHSTILPFVENLKNEVNTIIMRWNYAITNCSYFFIENSNITQIDLSKFDTSKVMIMEYMFKHQKI